MSTSNGYGWKPRQVETVETPSGVTCQVRRPGPEFVLRAGRVARTFSRVKSADDRQGKTEQEYGMDVLANMNDEELAAVMIFARELVCAMLVSPRLVQHPRPHMNEVGPEDIPSEDFWFLFNYAMTGFFGLKVPVGSEEVEVKDLETFPGDSGIQGDSVDGPHIPQVAEQSNEDQGLVGSAGA